jgi:hypothetical protein
MNLRNMRRFFFQMKPVCDAASEYLEQQFLLRNFIFWCINKMLTSTPTGA